MEMEIIKETALFTVWYTDHTLYEKVVRKVYATDVKKANVGTEFRTKLGGTGRSQKIGREWKTATVLYKNRDGAALLFREGGDGNDYSDGKDREPKLKIVWVEYGK